MLVDCRRKQSSLRANRRRRSPQMQRLGIRYALWRLCRRYDDEISLGGGRVASHPSFSSKSERVWTVDSVERFFFAGFGSDRVRVIDRAGSRKFVKSFCVSCVFSKLQLTNPRPRANTHGTTRETHPRVFTEPSRVYFSPRWCNLPAPSHCVLVLGQITPTSGLKYSPRDL